MLRRAKPSTSSMVRRLATGPSLSMKPVTGESNSAEAVRVTKTEAVAKVVVAIEIGATKSTVSIV